jgi:hypothetical protein
MAVCGAERGRLRYIYCGQGKPPGSAQRSHEEQRDHTCPDNQTQDAGAAVFVLNDTYQAQNEPERRPQD